VLCDAAENDKKYIPRAETLPDEILGEQPKRDEALTWKYRRKVLLRGGTHKSKVERMRIGNSCAWLNRAIQAWLNIPGLDPNQLLLDLIKS
jgi:hypothetical protein